MEVSDNDLFFVFDSKGEYEKFLTDVAGRAEEDPIYHSSRSASHT